MPTLNLDRKTFTRLLIGMIALIAVFGIIILAVILFPNIAGLFSGFFVQEEEKTPAVVEEETGPWGYKTFIWTYLDSQNEVSLTITNTTYKEFNSGVLGTNPINYTAISNDGGAVESVSRQLLSIASSKGYDSKQTLDLVVSFVKSIDYKADYESGHTYEYPRAPVVTLADQMGDSQDLTILAVSILKYLGYGTAIAYYPPLQDSVNLYPEATALAIIGTDSEVSPVYQVETTYPKSDFIFTPNTIYSTLTTGKTDSFIPDSLGWFSGTGFWSTENKSGNLSECIYVPSTGYFSVTETPAIQFDESKGITYRIENASWILPVEIIWIADPETKSVPIEVYNANTPEIISDNSLWKGKPCESTVKDDKLNVESVLGIPSPKYYDRSERTEWNTEAQDFFKEKSWYASDVSWTMNDKWKLYEHFLTVNDISGTALYTPWNTAECTADSSWRLSYTAKSKYGDSVDMTPYSSAQIAVYKILDDNSVSLVDITGWQGISDANKYGKTKIYEPGKYAIGIFIRNSEVKVTLEYFGTPSVTKYKGGI